MRGDPRGQDPGRGAAPPAWAERLLLRALPADAVGSSIAGDLREEYAELIGSQSRQWAARWYRRQVFGIAWRGWRDRLLRRGPFMGRTARGGDRRGDHHHRRDPMLATTLRSMKYALRGLARAPQFTLAAVLTLALAIGTNTAIFSVVQSILLRPLPFADSERLVMLRHIAPGLGYDRSFGISPGLYFLYSEGSDAFASSGIYTTATVNLTGGDATPARVPAARVSRTVFATLGTAPARGRVFDETEDQVGGTPVAVVSEGLARDWFGSPEAAVGQASEVDGETRSVVGVMPAGFEFPERTTRLWLPVALDPTEGSYGNFSFQAVARLHPGIDAADAGARLAPVLNRMRDDEQGASEDFAAFLDNGRLTAVVVPLKELMVGDISRALWILLGTVGFVFLIACANVTNLFLVRAEARQNEMAIRAALGAGRSGLIGHYASEALLIAGVSGAAGLALAWVSLRALLRVAPPEIPRLHEVSIDPAALAFTLIVSAVAAVLLGILPTLRLTSPTLLATVGRASRGSSAGRARNRARQTLVVAQTALALVLLVGSGLMVRSFQNLRALEPGFDPQNTTTFRLSLPAADYPDAERTAGFHGELLERLRAVPGVDHVGATSHPPLAGCCSGTAHVIEDQPAVPGQLPPMFWYSTVTAGYFEAMRIPVVAGRTFDASDGAGGIPVVVVSEALAARLWPEGDAVGRRLRPSTTDTTWYTIAGVVGSVRDQALERDPSQMVYYTVTATPADEHVRSMTYVVRSSRPDAVAPLARAGVWAVDPKIPVDASATYERIVADSIVRVSFTMIALVAASLIALLLGAIGLYSVISYIVAQRTSEIGIRMALGAHAGEVRRMVVLQGARMAATGLVIGIVAALALTRLMQGVLYGTAPTDATTYIVVTAVLGGIALLASWIPARRASRIDPASSLKGS